MHVAKFILYDVARKVDSCNIAQKVDAVLREKSFTCVNYSRTNSLCCQIWYLAKVNLFERCERALHVSTPYEFLVQ